MHHALAFNTLLSSQKTDAYTITHNPPRSPMLRGATEPPAGTATTDTQKTRFREILFLFCAGAVFCGSVMS
jgi:hypothetical protein